MRGTAHRPTVLIMKTFSVRRLLAVPFAVLLTTTALVALDTGPAQAAYSDPLVATGTSKMGLTYSAVNASYLSGLDTALPNVGVATVLDSNNHPMVSCNSEELAALPPDTVLSDIWCFDEGDATTLAWSPQGLTSSGDADNDGSWGAKRAILSGWVYDADDSRHNEARIAFIDYTNPASPVYRWVYLVTPTSATNFKASHAHIGGMVWYGDKLIVTAVGNTGTALLVYSMAKIWQMNSGASAIGLQSDGKYAAYGYQYVMPQIGSYAYTSGTCSMASATAIPCFSSISLDRTTVPDSLVTSEYFSDSALHGRLIRYPMGSDYRPANSATPSEAYVTQVGNQQGVLSHSGSWYVVHSSASAHGQLWRFTGSATGAGRTWSLHPEALTYWWDTNSVWAVTEWSRDEPTGPGGRVLFRTAIGDLS